MAGAPLRPAAPLDRRAAAVDHRRPQVGERVTRIGEHVPALVQPVKTSWTTSSPVAWSPVTNAASLTSPGRCTRYASVKPDSADDAGRSAVASGVCRSALGLMPTTLHAPA